MTIHILDLIVWFISLFVIWGLMAWVFDGEFTEELGAAGGVMVLFLYSLIYLIIFGILDYDIINVSELFNDSPIKIAL